nr:MAG TPA: kanamycin nucleotidyltransferase-like protein [Caudoviricetes sp.]
MKHRILKKFVKAYVIVSTGIVVLLSDGGRTNVTNRGSTLENTWYSDLDIIIT